MPHPTPEYEERFHKVTDEIYPMAITPMLESRDLAASKAFYLALGFRVIFEMPGNDGTTLLHLRFAKNADLLVIPEKVHEGSKKGVGMKLYFTLLDDDIDDFADTAIDRGAKILHPVETTAWNTREATFEDPDGFLITIGQQAHNNPTSPLE